MTMLDVDLAELDPKLAEILQLVPGSRVADGFEIPDDPHALFPTPYGDNPPADWFLEPHHDVIPGATGLITADGRFCAYSHEWHRCHVGLTADGTCWTPPRSVSGNRTFHQSSVVTAEGAILQVGVIPLGDGHAPLDATVQQAMAHYDRPERVRVRARAVETEHGAVMCGAIVPGATYHQVAVMRAAALSGDWRWIPELQALDFLGPCFVARPGLPLGLEQAALDQALWDIDRQVDMVASADGSHPIAVVGRTTVWSPRPAVTNNVPEPVVATAIGGSMTITDTGAPCACTPDTSDDQCRCTPTTAAAGTGLSYVELNQRVNEAVQRAFGADDIERGLWVWAADWDDEDPHVIVEIDPHGGDPTRTVRAPLQIDPDGTVTVDAGAAVDVAVEYVPVTAAIGDSALSRYIRDHWPDDDRTIGQVEDQIGRAAGITASTVGQIRQSSISCPPMAVLEGFAEALPGATVAGLIAAAQADGCTRYGDQASARPVQAAAVDQQLLELQQQVEQLAETVDALASDVARMSLQDLEPGEVVAELPKPPQMD